MRTLIIESAVLGHVVSRCTTFAGVLALSTLFACSGPQLARTEPEPETAAATQGEEEANVIPQPVGGAATVTGETPQESKLTESGKIDINAKIKERREALTLCYDTPLSTRTIGPDGFLVKVGFTIEATGRVSGVTVLEATERFPQAEQCFLIEVATIVFPPPPEGRVIEASYPFTIKRKGH